MINEQSLKTRVLCKQIEAQRKLPLAPDLAEQFKRFYEKVYSFCYWKEDSEPWQEVGKLVRGLPKGTLKSFLGMKIREIQRMIPDDFIDFLEADNTALIEELLRRTGAEMEQYNYISLLEQTIDDLNKELNELKAQQRSKEN